MHAEQYAAFLAAGDPPHEPTEAEQWSHISALRGANPDNGYDREVMRRHVVKCPICKANAAAGTPDWGDERWNALLGPLLPARNDPAEGGSA